MERIGEWSPETVAGAWFDGAEGPFAAPDSSAATTSRMDVVRTVTCVVIDARGRATFAWTVLDDAGQVGSIWRYDLSDGAEPAPPPSITRSLTGRAIPARVTGEA